MSTTTNETHHTDPELQLVDGPTLLKMLFPENCRPTHRWLQHQVKRKAIPSTKIGHLRFFVPRVVRTTLEQRHSCRTRGVR
jgi:hypothetical protein